MAGPCSPKHDPAQNTVFKKNFRFDGMELLKNIQSYGRAVYSQTRPSSFHGVEKPSCLDVTQPNKTFKFFSGPRSLTSPVTA